MTKTYNAYLRDILRECDDIAAFTADDQIAFSQDLKTQKAVIRSYEVIGEICKRLAPEIRDSNPQIDWRKLINFRDFLAHNYESIILRYIWDAVTDLPTLRAAIEALLASLPPDADAS